MIPESRDWSWEGPDQTKSSLLEGNGVDKLWGNLPKCQLLNIHKPKVENMMVIGWKKASYWFRREA